MDSEQWLRLSGAFGELAEAEASERERRLADPALAAQLGPALHAELRKMLATTPEARARGYGPSRFSFNVEGSRPSIRAARR